MTMFVKSNFMFVLVDHDISDLSRMVDRVVDHYLSIIVAFTLLTTECWLDHEILSRHVHFMSGLSPVLEYFCPLCFVSGLFQMFNVICSPWNLLPVLSSRVRTSKQVQESLKVVDDGGAWVKSQYHDWWACIKGLTTSPTFLFVP